MKEKPTYSHLNVLFDKSIELGIRPESRIVIFSDLHMGDGSSNDDFKENAHLFHTILGQYYNNKGFQLLLNGDIEELQRFTQDEIAKQWKETYQLFDQFAEDGRLFKMIGNHDMSLLGTQGFLHSYPLFETIKLNFRNHHFFVFHGHQVSKKYQKNNELIGFTLKYVANPLGIKNYSVSHSSKKQFRIEKKIYQYSKYKGIASIIGHTHRPLFETPLSKGTQLKQEIDRLCKIYMDSSIKDQKAIEEQIKSHKKSLKKLNKAAKLTYKSKEDNIYDLHPIFYVPCLFNSGCVIGKRGVTGIEICGNKIKLVHWFHKNIHKKYLHHNGNIPEQLNRTTYFRQVLKQESLRYIFTRIKLLT